MDPLETDRRIRADLHRWSLIGGISGGALLVGAGLLIAIGGLRAGTVGVAGMAALMSVVMLDAVVRLPRPDPYVGTSAVVVPVSRLVGVLVLLMGAMVGLLAFGVLTQDVSDQRGAALRYAVPVVAALLLVWGALTVGRPTRLVVSASGLTTTGPRGRTIAWDDITSIAPASDAVKGSGNTALPVTIRSATTRLDVLTRWTRPTLWVLIEWLEHYRMHPDDRGELGGAPALERLSAVDARLRNGTARPGWFPGPVGTR